MSADATFRDVGDVVVEDAARVTVEDAEDVAVAAGAVAGDLAVEGAGDVYVGATDGLLLESVEDVYLEGNCFDGGRATVRGAQDVLAEPDAVDGELTVENPEDVLVGDEIEVEHEQYDTTYEAAPDRVRLVDVEDVDLAAGALTDRVWVTDAEWVGGR